MKINLIIAILFIYGIVSFRNEGNVDRNADGEYLKEKIGDQIQFPKNANVIYADNFLYDSTSAFNFPVKIITYIDFGCGYCHNELIELQNFLNNFKKDKVGLIVYGYTETGLSGYYAFISNYPDFAFPIFADIKKEYLKINDIGINDRNLQTFLIDNKNVIRLVGNPITNEKINNLYISEIQKMISNQ